MKRIIVCFKITDDYDELSIADWNRPQAEGRPQTDFVRRIPGCFDEAALENGLLLNTMLREADEETELIGLTVNPGYSDHIISRIAAVGYDHIISLVTDSDTDFAPETTAELLFAYIREIPDVYAVLTGAQSAPGNTGIVPYALAQRLETEVKDGVICFGKKDDWLILEREMPDCYVVEAVQPGAVYILKNTKKSFLRIPTLREKMKYKDYRPKKCQISRTPDHVEVVFRLAITERHCTFLNEEEERNLLNSLKE